MEFDDVLFQVESSRVCSLARPRFWVVGTNGCFVKRGLDPQEEALRAGHLDDAYEPPEHQSLIRRQTADGTSDTRVETVRGSWDSYYANIADHLNGLAPLAVTAEEGREVVRILDAAIRSSNEHRTIEGPWG
jgi:scyllo-inositol 2-dehydrogenase (NADP+)